MIAEDEDQKSCWYLLTVGVNPTNVNELEVSTG